MKNSDSKHRIAELLNHLGINQTDFCKKTGLQKSALSNYLNGTREPRQDQISKISEAYSIDPAWIMGYDVPMEWERPEIFDTPEDFEKAWNDSGGGQHPIKLTDEEYSFIIDIRARHDPNFYKRMRAYMDLFEKRGDEDAKS